MQPTHATATTGVSSAPSDEDKAMRGFVAGLIPLGAVVLVVVITIALDALARALSAGQGFFVQQWVEVIVYVLGLIVSIATLAVLSRRTLLRVARWRVAGHAGKAAGALWGLTVTAFVVILPVVLAIVAPQHPYP
jgi:hypothetical protein